MGIVIETETKSKNIEKMVKTKLSNRYRVKDSSARMWVVQ